MSCMSGSKVLLRIVSERDYVKNLYYFPFVVVSNGAERWKTHIIVLNMN